MTQLVSVAMENPHSDGDRIMKTHNADTARTLPSRSACAIHTVPAWNPDGSAVAVGKRKRAFDYCRVSTDMQAQFGLSLDAQRNQIAAYAKAYGYEVIGFYVDHESAKNVTGRPEYQKMIAEVDKGMVSFIISSALDRFSRSQRDFLAFQDDYVRTDKVHLHPWTQTNVYDLLIKERIHVVRSDRGDKVHDKERA